MSLILVVDDNPQNRYQLEHLLGSQGHRVMSASDGERGLEAAQRETPDLIISDVLMPKMDGFALCRALKKDAICRRVPFVFYTATYADDQDEAFALSLGADRFLCKPLDLPQVLAVVDELLFARARAPGSSLPVDDPAVLDHSDSDELRRHNAILHRKLEMKMAQLQTLNLTLERALNGTVTALSRMGELRDPYTAGHERRVADLAVHIGRELGMSEDRQTGLRVAGLLHDLGKFAVPAEILAWPGKLSRVQMEYVRTHAAEGHRILKDVDFPWPVAEVALQHHERLDGSGYPAGLVGEQILLEARIVGVADVIEAMATHRPYRPALGVEVALAEIEQHAGRLYDPVVAATAVSLFREGGYRLLD